MTTTAKLSVEEYERMIASGAFDGRNKRRVELIWGELREMNPIGSEHAMVLNRLNRWSFQVAGDKFWIRVQDPVAFLNAESEPEPDLVWAKWRDYTTGNPAAEDVKLLIEVADSSLHYDRGDKAKLYAEAGIQDYWIVNLVNRTVEVRRDLAGDIYRSSQSFGRGEGVEPLILPTARLSVDLLFAAIE